MKTGQRRVARLLLLNGAEEPVHGLYLIEKLLLRGCEQP
jgi:hypothetical protein